MSPVLYPEATKVVVAAVEAVAAGAGDISRDCFPQAIISHSAVLFLLQEGQGLAEIRSAQWKVTGMLAKGKQNQASKIVGF